MTMSASPGMLAYLWSGVSLLIGAMEIMAAAIYLSDRCVGPWLMLAGATIGTIAGLVGSAIVILMSHQYSDLLIKLMSVSCGVGGLGWLVFSAGLVLHAMRRKKLADRGVELEAIIASMPNR